jgi:hypothetical protein
MVLRVSSNRARRRLTLHFRRREVAVICSDFQGELVAYELISSFSLSNHYMGVRCKVYSSQSMRFPRFSFTFCEAWYHIAITIFKDFGY